MAIWISLLYAAITYIFIRAIIGAMLKKYNLRGKHALITGGSKGIGLALARELVRKECDVSIIARNQTDLLVALQELDSLAKQIKSPSKIQTISADTTNSDEILKATQTAVASAGPIDVLICNAGLSIPGLFIDQSLKDFEKQIEVNYMGTVKTIKCMLPGMLARRQGHIVIITSMLSVLGFAGYSSYAPTKWALRGLADCLHNELQGTGVRISVGYPPDTDTPGYAQEEQTKPGLCKAVNKALGSELFSSEKVAFRFVRLIERGAYHLTPPDVGSALLVSTMTSLSPKSIPLPFVALISPILHVVTSVFGSLGSRAARKYNEEHGYNTRVT